MRTSPSILPRDDDQNVYLVQDNFGGRLGRSLASPDDTDFEAIIRDLLDGQYPNPSDSTLQMAGRDVSESSSCGDVATCRMRDVPSAL
jgi:hypothetical protein